ncbi:unnamed protein product [Peronospora destructor]|uniref:Uncharacterized protein n=1 Tax=Peronospora destructor TaxID=86335 RepID=A0AAV0U8A2_9STRA|nr:unnamed protein product [Peronospora destructor]
MSSRRSRRNSTYREKETFRLHTKPTQASISNLLRGKEKLLKAAVPPNFRSSRRVKYPNLDRKMLLWEMLRATAEAVKRVELQQQKQQIWKTKQKQDTEKEEEEKKEEKLDD